MSYSIASTVSATGLSTLPKLSQGSALLSSISKVAFSALSGFALSLQSMPPAFPVIVHLIVGLIITIALLHLMQKASVLDIQYVPLEPARCSYFPMYNTPHIHVRPSYSHFERRAPIRYVQPIYREPRPSFLQPSIRMDRVGERRSF